MRSGLASDRYGSRISEQALYGAWILAASRRLSRSEKGRSATKQLIVRQHCIPDLAAKKIDSLFAQVYRFRRLSIDFSVLPFFRRGTLRQTVIADYIASAIV